MNSNEDFEYCVVGNKYYVTKLPNITSTGGSVVEFSPATREARVRFPAGAISFFHFLSKSFLLFVFFYFIFFNFFVFLVFRSLFLESLDFSCMTRWSSGPNNRKRF